MDSLNSGLSGHVLLARASGQNTGTHRQQDTSVSSLLSTLLPIIVVASVIMLAFIFFQKKLERVYGPRTYLGALDEDERSPKMTSGFMGWTKEYRALADEYVLTHSSLDNYLFLRYFKMLTLMAFVGCLITWPILFPINATGGGGASGLNILSFSNVSDANRFYAHALVMWIYFAFVMVLITRESLLYIHLRRAFLLSPFNSSRISSRTVLFMNVPEEYRDVSKVREAFPDVRAVWLVYKDDDLEDLVDERDDAEMKLEKGEAQLISSYIKQKKKDEKKGGSGHESETGQQRSEKIQIDQKDRPTHKTKFLIGKKVDTIDWSRGELKRTLPEIRKHREQALVNGEGEAVSACFVEFGSVRAAQLAYNGLLKDKKFPMEPRAVGVTPDQILWKNLKHTKAEQWAKHILFSAIIAFLCIFWTIPVAFIGFITHIKTLTTVPGLSWLSFINNIPGPVIGVVTGLLPVILLSVLMSLVPIFCVIFASTYKPTTGEVQLQTQNWYMAFQFIQVFLITTFTSGAASVISKIIQDPSIAATLLAQNLPTASNFYLSYFIIFGLITASLQLLNIVPLLMFMFLGKFLDKTPRKVYNRYVTLTGLGWGALYPKFSNLGVIALSYAVISPLVLGFATLGFLFLYLAYRYNALFTLGTNCDTQGRAYARAMQHLTIGIYLAEVCLIGLFAINSAGSLLTIGPLVITVILLITTIVWHVAMRKKIDRMEIQLLNDIEIHESRGADAEKGYRQYSSSDGEHTSSDGAHDTHANPRLGAGQGEYPDNRQYEGGYNQQRTEQDYRQNDAEERHHHDGNGGQAPGSHAAYGHPEGGFIVKRQGEEVLEQPPGMMGKVKAFFMPHKYATSAVLSKEVLSPHLSEPVRNYTREEHDNAYRQPTMWSPVPVIWLARDPYGLSKQEIEAGKQDMGDQVDVTDDGAWYNEKAKPEIDHDNIERLPVWQDLPIY